MNKIFEIGILRGLLCPFLTGVLLLTAGNINAQIVEYVIVRDVSESTIEGQELKADEVFRKVIIDLDLKNSKKGVNLRTTLCGQSTIPEVKLAPLPEQTSIFSSSTERTKDLKKFLAKAKTDIDYLVDHPKDQPQTNLYRALVHVTGQFDRTASSKTLIVISDLAEVSSVFNTTKYADDPSALMSDYNAIIKAMEQDSVLPDLSGFTIHLVTPGTTDFHIWLSRFWSKLLMSKGAEKVIVRATF